MMNFGEMDFENLEQLRYFTHGEAMKALSEIVQDKKAPTEDRLKAAKVLNGYSDSLIQAYLITKYTNVREKQGDKLTKQIDQMMDGDKEK